MVAAHEYGALAGGQLRRDGRQAAILRIQGHRAIAQCGQLQHVGVGGVQHGHARRHHHVDLAAHGLVQASIVEHVEILDALYTAHVGDDADLALVIGQAFGQDHAWIALEQGRLHGAVEQQALARVPVHAIAADDTALVQVHAFAADGARVQARQVEQFAQHAHDQAGAARARHADQRNAARFLGREQVVDDGRADRAGLAHARLDVRQQAGAGIDFDDGAALLCQRTRDVGGDQVDAGDIEADDPGGEQGRMHDGRMHVVRDVDGHVAVRLDQHFLAGLRHGQGGHALALQFQHDFARFVRLDGAQWEIFAFAAARVGIDLRVDQFQHGGDAVAVDPQGFALGGRDQLVADDEQAVFVARDEAFHQHSRAVALACCQLIGRFHVAFRHQVERNAAAMVAVIRFHDDRHADVLCFFPGRFGAAHQAAFRDAHAARFEQEFGQVLVAGDAFGNRAGAVRFGRPDAALRGAVAQLYQVAVVQAQRRDAALGGRIDDAGRARAQAARIDHVAQGRQGRFQVVGFIIDGGHQQFARGGQGGAAHVLFTRAESHLVDAALAGRARLAEARAHACQVLQFQHHVFEDVRRPGAFAQALEKAAPLAHAAAVFDHAGQPCHQALVQAGQGIGWIVFQFADVDPGFNHRAIRPDVGAAQVGDAGKFDVLLLDHVSGFLITSQASGRQILYGGSTESFQARAWFFIPGMRSVPLLAVPCRVCFSYSAAVVILIVTNCCCTCYKDTDSGPSWSICATARCCILVAGRWPRIFLRRFAIIPYRQASIRYNTGNCHWCIYLAIAQYTNIDRASAPSPKSRPEGLGLEPEYALR